jgi:integrase
MKLNLTTKTVTALALPKGKGEEFAWDTELRGFGFRLRRGADGGLLRTWVAQYRANGHLRRVTVGDANKVGVTQAREAARKILARVALGHDPQAEKEAKRAAAERTFRSAVEAYLESKRAELRPTSLRLAKLYLAGSYFKSLQPIGVDEITHPDVAARLSAIARAHSPSTAAAARRHVSAFFKWTVEEGWTRNNPVIGTRKPADPRPRDRVLTDAELVAIWRACGDDDHGRIVRLLILLGSRRQEVGGMRWSEFDLERGTWALPADRAKNKHAIIVALPPTAVAIINSVPRTTRDHLFGVHGDGGFSSWARSKAQLDRRLGHAVKPWRLHDIRRSVATGMADVGIEPHIVEAALNHYSGHRRGVAGVYNRSSYERAVKAALARWDEHVLALVEERESNVVSMQRA